MKSRLFFSVLFASCFCAFATADEKGKPLPYPDAAKGQEIDNYHGTKVADPYRWLEDPDSSASRKWIEEENRITFRFLDAIPERPAIKARLRELWDYERYGVPFKENDRYFFSK